MSLIAGVDIGNSTTEIVIARDGIPVAWDRRPTRGHKGSGASIQAAAALLRSIERQHSLTADRVVVAPWFPVTTATTTVHESAPDTGAIQLIANATHSVVGNSHAIGIPWDITTPLPGGSMNTALVAVVPVQVSFEAAAALVNTALDDKVAVVAVAIANDEAVLKSARVHADLPMVDRVDVAAALAAQQLFVEVRPAGTGVSVATDVWALKSGLGLDDSHDEALGLISRWVRDERAVVIGVFPGRISPVLTQIPSLVTTSDGLQHDLFDFVSQLRGNAIGAVTNMTLAHQDTTAVQDLWAVDLSEQLQVRGIRLGSHARSLALATLTGDQVRTSNDLETIFGVPVTVGASEAHAAAVGAHTTPGSNPNAVVLDIGGGTIDAITQRQSQSQSQSETLSAAGAGEMLTAAVAQVLDVPRGAADWIKRGPAQRVEAPAVVLTETGGKVFIDEGNYIPAALVGSLVAPGPSGYLPFGSQLAPAEWRIIRQGLKTAVLGDNVERLMQSLDAGGSQDVIVVGGPAADDELLPVIAQQPGIGGLGRGNIAGVLGHRYAVAYGLTCLV